MSSDPPTTVNYTRDFIRTTGDKEDRTGKFLFSLITEDDLKNGIVTTVTTTGYKLRLNDYNRTLDSKSTRRTPCPQRNEQ